MFLHSERNIFFGSKEKGSSSEKKGRYDSGKKFLFTKKIHYHYSITRQYRPKMSKVYMFFSLDFLLFLFFQRKL